jgi:adenine deaminase
MVSIGTRGFVICPTYVFWRRVSQVSLASLIAVAKRELPADLLLVNARIVNTFTGEIEPGNVAVYGGTIAGVGDYSHARQVVDLGGRYLAPGLINGHTHVESSMLHITQYARAVVPRGTTALVTDLHEIANVRGLEGMKYMLRWARRLPLDLFLMVPSCVPATSLETSGARLNARDIRAALRWGNAIGLGEVMNFPGVLGGDREVLEKVAVARTGSIDGHAPGLWGRGLNAYIASGILSDHESTTAEEAGEKLRRGMYLMIREGSSEKNLDALLPLVTDSTYKRCLFVVDDRSCVDLLRDGDIDAVVRKAIRGGLDPVRALQLATINAAEYFRLGRVGVVAPGYLANLIVIADLATLGIEKVFYRGRLVAEGGEPLFGVPSRIGGELTRSVKIRPFTVEALRIPATRYADPIIELVPDQILTRKRWEEMAVSGGGGCARC